MTSEAFLQSVESLNAKLNAVDMVETIEPLLHSFWSYAEIRNVSGDLLADWEVPSQLVPFYGDWHTLLCLDEVSGAVVYLDDDRNELFRWKSAEEFLEALRQQEEEPVVPEELDGVEFELDPNLLK